MWTVNNIPDQSSKVILITGATSGIGLHTARTLASRGASLILACRNPQKMASVAEECRHAGAKAVTELVLDTSDLESVRQCASSYDGPPIDVLILNAGQNGTKWRATAQGYERMFVTNYMGHWLLTGLLLNRILGRIVVVSSIGHRFVHDINWASVRGDTHDTFGLYFQSKLANLLFVEELNRRLVNVGSNLIVVGAHPGVASTELEDKSDSSVVIKILSRFASRLVSQSAEEGALPLLMAATDDAASREYYYAPSTVLPVYGETYGAPFAYGRKSETVTNNWQLAEKLWIESERMCNFKYPF